MDKGKTPARTREKQIREQLIKEREELSGRNAGDTAPKLLPLESERPPIERPQENLEKAESMTRDYEEPPYPYPRDTRETVRPNPPPNHQQETRGMLKPAFRTAPFGREKRKRVLWQDGEQSNDEESQSEEDEQPKPKKQKKGGGGGFLWGENEAINSFVGSLVKNALYIGGVVVFIGFKTVGLKMLSDYSAQRANEIAYGPTGSINRSQPPNTLPNNVNNRPQTPMNTQTQRTLPPQQSSGDLNFYM